MRDVFNYPAMRQPHSVFGGLGIITMASFFLILGRITVASFSLALEPLYNSRSHGMFVCVSGN